MTAEFFALAFAAAINPSLLGIDLLLIVNRRPTAMLAFVLAGGIAMAVTIGLVDVLVIRSDLVKYQGSIGDGGDLVIGLFLIAVGGLIIARRRGGGVYAEPAARPEEAAAGRLDAARARPAPAGARVAVGAVLGLPGALYLTALHNLVAGNWSTATQVIAVLVFAVIEFTLVIVPLALLISRPQRAAAVLHGTQDWLARHGRTALAYVISGLGLYLTISSIASLIG